jgi:23S rRNA (adenine2030-N6)-methyltransferase
VNYRHAFHAGNPGDVLKHAALAFVLERLKAKPTPFRFLDTHAGVGRYDLAGPAAQKTGEWRAGVGKLWDERPGGEAGAALAPWYAVLDALNPSGGLRWYPGSPELAARLLRPADRARLYELHPRDGPALARRYAGDARVEIRTGDGWAALGRDLPPPERRGVVLVDPPFEDGREFVRLSEGLARAHRRFATGVFLLWYPVKGAEDVRGLIRALRAIPVPKMLRAELHWRAPNHPGRLDGAGLVLVNAPFGTEPALGALLPVLADRLASGPGAGHALEELTPERL